MAAKYDFETLSQALDMMKSDDPEGRRKGEKVLRQAACLELGTKNTVPVREWFISHTKELMEAITSEKDAKLLWGYIYMLQAFCQRYIQEAYLVCDSEKFISDGRTAAFKIQAWKTVNGFLSSSNLSVLQAAGSFIWIYGDSRAWDIFAKVLDKKRDKLTLSHISIAIGGCRRCLIEGGELKDIYNNTVTMDKLIESEQARKLLKKFTDIMEKTSTAKRLCAVTIDNLREIMSVL